MFTFEPTAQNSNKVACPSASGDFKALVRMLRCGVLQCGYFQSANENMNETALQLPFISPPSILQYHGHAKNQPAAEFSLPMRMCTRQHCNCHSYPLLPFSSTTVMPRTSLQVSLAGLCCCAGAATTATPPPLVGVSQLIAAM